MKAREGGTKLYFVYVVKQVLEESCHAIDSPVDQE